MYVRDRARVSMASQWHHLGRFRHGECERLDAAPGMEEMGQIRGLSRASPKSMMSRAVKLEWDQGRVWPSLQDEFGERGGATGDARIGRP